MWNFARSFKNCRLKWRLTCIPNTKYWFCLLFSLEDEFQWFIKKIVRIYYKVTIKSHSSKVSLNLRLNFFLGYLLFCYFLWANNGSYFKIMTNINGFTPYFRVFFGEVRRLLTLWLFLAKLGKNSFTICILFMLHICIV